MKREYVATVTAAEVARLRAFDNERDAATPGSQGAKRAFRRRDATTFVVQEYAGSGLGGGTVVSTRGTATLPDASDRVLVTVESTGHRLGYVLAGFGIVLACSTPWRGVAGLLVGAAILLAAWFLFIRPPRLADELDAVEELLRAEIRGHWQPVGADGAASYDGPPRTDDETADRLTRFLCGERLDDAVPLPLGWSVTNLLPARTVVADGVLVVRRRGRASARLPLTGLAFVAQVRWTAGPATEHPAVETWVVDHDGRPRAVVGWDARAARQASASGLSVRRFAHDVTRDAVLRAWPGRPAHPVRVFVDPTTCPSH